MKLKKYSLLIFSIIISILLFLEHWFEGELFSCLWVIALLIYIPLLIGYCICLFLSVIQIISKKHEKKYSLLSIIILGGVAILDLFFPFSKVKAEVELILYKNQRNEIIKKVKNNEYSYYDDGNIK